MSLLVLCEGLASQGAVANVAWQQAVGLCRFQTVCVISDGFSSERLLQNGLLPGLRLRKLFVPTFFNLHRFGHLPRQLAWILRALQATAAELPSGAVLTVICHSHPLAAAVAFRFGRRVRLVMVSHGDVFQRPPGSYDPAITRLYRWTTQPAHLQADVSVALSPAMVRLIEGHGVRPDRIALIPNGLDPAEIGLCDPPFTANQHWDQSPLRLLFIGRLDRVKGLDVLLEAVSLVLRQGVMLRLDLIGPGSSAQIQDLEHSLRSRDLLDVICWHGPQSRRLLATHYARCHVVVVPSLDDPLPTVVLEAMACGRSLVASAVGGIPYLLQDGECGLLVPAGDALALADALVRLDRDRALACDLGRRALQRSAQFSWAANVQALQSLISRSSA